MLNQIRHMIKGAPTCRKVNAFLLDFVEGRLDKRTAERFELHIDVCPNCRTYLDQYRQTVELVREVPPPRVPVELEERTCRFIEEALEAQG